MKALLAIVVLLPALTGCAALPVAVSVAAGGAGFLANAPGAFDTLHNLATRHCTLSTLNQCHTEKSR